MRVISRFANSIIVVVTSAALILGLIITVPNLFGIHPYIVESGSMEPIIHTGSLAYINEKDQEPELGDIIMYCLVDSKESTIFVTHRMIGIDEDGNYITKGDANETEDLVPVQPEQVIGTYIGSIPEMGYILAEFQGKKMIAAAVWVLILNAIGILLEIITEEEMKDEY